MMNVQIYIQRSVTVHSCLLVYEKLQAIILSVDSVFISIPYYTTYQNIASVEECLSSVLRNTCSDWNETLQCDMRMERTQNNIPEAVKRRSVQASAGVVK